ncbi:MAG: LysR family transcriptional regulator, partial [Myxococcota bacterium]
TLFRSLAHFVAAVDHGTLRDAAEASHISQPGLSMSLARLEDFLGASLLERKPRGVTTTPYGDALYRHAKIVLAHLRHAQGEIDSLRGDDTSELRLGVGASFMNRALPRVIAKLFTTRPGFTLNIAEGIAEDQIPKLMEGELDLVLVRFPTTPPHDELIYETLHRRQLCAWVRADHPLALRPQPIALDELAGERWIIPDSAPSEIAGPIYRALQRSGKTFRPSVQTNSVAFLKRLLVESDCVALLPEGAMADEVADGEIKALPLPGIDLEDEVGAVYRRELAELPVLAEIIAALRLALPEAGLI